MKILLVTSYFTPASGGLSTYASRFASALAHKHRITVITVQHNRSLPLISTSGTTRVLRHRALFQYGRGLYSPRLTLSFLKLMPRTDRVILIAPMAEACMLALLAFLFRKRLLLVYLTDMRVFGGLLSAIVQKLNNVSIMLASALSKKIVVTSTDYASGSLIRRYHRKFVPIDPPIETSHFFREEVAANCLRRSLGIGDQEVVIGFLGRFTIEKGIEVLVNSLPLIINRIPKARLLLGEIPTPWAYERGAPQDIVKDRVRELVRRLQIESYVVEKTIDRSELRPFYSACDVFVLPSIDRLEAFGMVQVEAMLCGTPVVSSLLPGVSRPLSLTGFGRLVLSGNIKDLANGIIQLIGERQNYKLDRSILVSAFGVEAFATRFETEVLL